MEKKLCSEPDYAGQHDVRAAFGALEEEERIIVAFSVWRIPERGDRADDRLQSCYGPFEEETLPWRR